MELLNVELEQESILETASELTTTIGISDEIKQALLQCFEHVAWVDDEGQTYYDALYDALYPPVDLSSISCVYTQSGTVYDTDSLDSLKSDLVVTAHYSDQSTETVTTYTLSGTLAEGTSTITVLYGGKATTFDVEVTSIPTVSSISAVYTQSGTVYNTDNIDSLKNNLVVTATWTDSSTTVIESTNYTLSGTLTVGVSTITVSYIDKTTTFNVTVTQNPDILISDYDAFVKGFVTYSNRGKEVNTTYKKGAGAILIDVPLEAGCTFSLPDYTNYKFSISKIYQTGAEVPYIIADSTQDYTLSAQDAEDAVAITVAHRNSDEMTASEIAFLDSNAKFIRAQ